MRIFVPLLFLSFAAQAADPNLKISVSASTNTKPYEYAITPNGKVVGTAKTLPVALTNKLFRDARAAGQLDQVEIGHCMKSASFGTSTTVEFNGHTSPDLSCGSPNANAEALWSDVKQVVTYLRAGSLTSTGASHP